MIAENLRRSVLSAAVTGQLFNNTPGSLHVQPLLIPGQETTPCIPETWQIVRLGEMAVYIQRGKSPKYSDFSPYLAISQKCVQWNMFDVDKARRYDKETFEALPSQRRLKAGDLLWNSTGTGTVGRARVLTEADITSNPKMAADSHVTVIRCGETLEPEFLQLYISSSLIQDAMPDLVSGTTKQKELNLATIKQLNVPVPPLETQMDIIRGLKQLLPLIDRLAELERERERI